MELRWLTGTFAVCRLDPMEPLPLPGEAELFAVTWTPDELSLVCPVDAVPDGCTQVEQPWCAFAVSGPLDFALTGRTCCSGSESYRRSGLPQGWRGCDRRPWR